MLLPTVPEGAAEEARATSDGTQTEQRDSVQNSDKGRAEWSVLVRVNVIEVQRLRLDWLFVAADAKQNPCKHMHM